MGSRTRTALPYFESPIRITCAPSKRRLASKAWANGNQLTGGVAVRWSVG